MRAVRFHGRGDIRVDQIEEPVCGNGQVKIKPAFAGICGSDLHEYLIGPTTIPVTPHPITGAMLPVTLGHEFSGVVEDIGASVTRVKVGDRVVVKPNLYDETCPSCRVGRMNSCRNLGFIGYSSNAGGMSDFVVVQERNTIPLPDSFPLDIGALVEPLTVAWHAVKRTPIQNITTTTALITGGGPIGLAIVQVLKSQGIPTIIVSEVSAQRRAFAKTLGATHVFDPITDNIVDKVCEMTDDAGADIAFECSGVQAGIDAAIAGICVRGTVTIVSLWEVKPVIDAFEVVLYEKHVIGAAIHDYGEFEAVIEAILSGKLDPRPMITSKIRMEDVEEKGFKALINEKDKHVKILIDIAGK
ncbi:hypothetical protein ASPWEDRAFT_26889 [Aspergillus wentii DTO 134E9]|uniref:Enoyl reductase (ER) domain-containing protein n=1 Tax=Aspergillus wentii DTO 134E9 TaxID=1073089 RepID=A0A1L9RRL8_ASPWE|nr:uncharacterized protein ASPWEDRAFT_26889 [Aspergillus wentii DTO 134E9]KAI9930359.1 hypothetical protein MW887_011112 [Aspergillus wentii]OJJ37513.1 hypothetical protein ASPWEDRAFT_26889 [Aspergillus wentii DTO 134E9]